MLCICPSANATDKETSQWAPINAPHPPIRPSVRPSQSKRLNSPKSQEMVRKREGEKVKHFGVTGRRSTRSQEAYHLARDETAFVAAQSVCDFGGRGSIRFVTVGHRRSPWPHMNPREKARREGPKRIINCFPLCWLLSSVPVRLSHFLAHGDSNLFPKGTKLWPASQPAGPPTLFVPPAPSVHLPSQPPPPPSSSLCPPFARMECE